MSTVAGSVQPSSAVQKDGAGKGQKPEESHLALVRRARRMTRVLADEFPDAHCELDFTTPLELAVAVILSAQATDVKVNEVTPALFARYRTAADYAGANRSELEEMVHQTGFYRNKAASLMGLGAALVERFGGEVPGRLVDLVSLPGPWPRVPPTWCSATRSACRGSPWTRISAGWYVAGAGPTRRTRSRSST